MPVSCVSLYMCVRYLCLCTCAVDVPGIDLPNEGASGLPLQHLMWVTENHGAERLRSNSCLAEYDASILNLSSYSVLRRKLRKSQLYANILMQSSYSWPRASHSILSPAQTKADSLFTATTRKS